MNTALDVARQRHEHNVHVLRVEYRTGVCALTRQGLAESDAHDEMFRRARVGLTFDTQHRVTHNAEILTRVAVATVQRG